MKRIKKKAKRILKGINELERQIGLTTDHMFRDINIDGIVTLDEVATSYFGLLREGLQERKRRKRRKKTK